MLQLFIGAVSQILVSEGSCGSQRVVQNRPTPDCEDSGTWRKSLCGVIMHLKLRLPQIISVDPASSDKCPFKRQRSKWSCEVEREEGQRLEFAS